MESIQEEEGQDAEDLELSDEGEEEEERDGSEVVERRDAMQIETEVCFIQFNTISGWTKVIDSGSATICSACANLPTQYIFESFRKKIKNHWAVVLFHYCKH